MQAFQHNNTQSSHEKLTSSLCLNRTQLQKPKPSSFSPFLANKLEVQGNHGFAFGSLYSPRHNMIIACPSNSPMQFFDATTFLPLKEREPLNLDASVVDISFDPETDTYLMGCNDECIYTYNASSNELKKLKNCENSQLAVIFLKSQFYAFPHSRSKQLFLGNFKDYSLLSFPSQNSAIYSLQHLTQQNLLLSGLDNGSMMIYCTKKLPYLRILGSVRAHRALVFTVRAANLHGKEYIITASLDGTMKIWHFVKRRMRLLRVIQAKGTPMSVVFLENYKMIAVACNLTDIKFFRFSSGKLESTVPVSTESGHSLFEMEEKKMIGVMSSRSNGIEFIRLEGAQVQGGC